MIELLLYLQIICASLMELSNIITYSDDYIHVRGDIALVAICVKWVLFF